MAAAEGKDAGKTRVAFSSVLVGVTLTGTKLAVGLLTGSLGILSEAAHSLLDLGAALITFFSVRASVKPPDRAHQYGHGKIENLSALAQAVLLLLTCVWIVYEAIRRLLHGGVEVEATFWAFFVMGVSLVLDVAISRALSAAARKHRSQALEADALHYSSDILSSAVVIAGLVGVRLGVPALDPVAALGVAILVTVASVRLSKRAIDELLDRSPGGLDARIGSAVAALPGVDRVEKVRVRRSGAAVFVDLVVAAGRLQSLGRGHELSERIEAAVTRLAPGSDTTVHIHPSSDGESVTDSVRAAAERIDDIREVHNVHCYRDERRGKHFVSLHVKLDPSLPLEEAHAIADRLEESLKRETPSIEEVAVHIETAAEVASGFRAEPPPDRLRALADAVARDRDVSGIHDVLLHHSSGGTIVTCHVVTPGTLPLEEAHAVATRVERCVKSCFPEAASVVVHTEPEKT